MYNGKSIQDRINGNLYAVEKHVSKLIDVAKETIQYATVAL